MYNNSDYMALFLLVVVVLTPGITSIGQGYSHCMADSTMGQHRSSLYEQYCCTYGNRGKTFNLKENEKMIYILCPLTRPKSCPGNISSATLVYHLLYVIALVPPDCKSWYEAGNTTSGVYLINPNVDSPFEVSCSILILIFHYMSLYIGLL